MLASGLQTLLRLPQVLLTSCHTSRLQTGLCSPPDSLSLLLTSLSVQKSSEAAGEHMDPLSITSPGQRQLPCPEARERIPLAPLPFPGLYKTHTGPNPTSAWNHQGTSNDTAQGSRMYCVFLAHLEPSTGPPPPCLREPVSSHEAGVILLWGASSRPASTSHPVATQGPADLSTCI